VSFSLVVIFSVGAHRLVSFADPSRLTGDHPATAAVIAREVEVVGADSPKGTVMTVRGFFEFSLLSPVSPRLPQAPEFNRLTDAEIDKLTQLPLVIARCDPETKVRMIEAGARRGLFMAMTGDGVNGKYSSYLQLYSATNSRCIYRCAGIETCSSWNWDGRGFRCGKGSK